MDEIRILTTELFVALQGVYNSSSPERQAEFTRLLASIRDGAVEQLSEFIGNDSEQLTALRELFKDVNLDWET